MRHLKCWSLLVAAAALCGAPASSAILRVKPDAPGPAHDGSSWGAAFLKVQDALTAAAAGDEVWVAAGRYPENVTVSKSLSLYGGFAGTETARSQRNPAANVSKLVSAADQRVVTISPGSDGTTLDGFTITRDVDARGIGYVGGGILVAASNVTVSGNVTSGNHADGNGGGILVTGLSAQILGNVIADNSAYQQANTTGPVEGNGGGICVAGGSATIRGNTISGNGGGSYSVNGFWSSGTGSGGGGIMVSRGNAAILGNRITGNVAFGGADSLGESSYGEADGGGISFVSSSGRIANNVVSGNRASAGATSFYYPISAVSRAYGAGIYLYMSDVTVASNTIGQNTASQWASDGMETTVTEKAALEANIQWQYFPPHEANNLILESDSGASALFADKANGDFRLLPGSPLIDTGDDAAVVSGETDAAGNPRMSGQHVDPGAYEAPVGTTATGLAWAGAIPDIRSGTFTPAPVAYYVDAMGHRVTSQAGQIAVSVKPGTGTPGTAVTGTAAVSATRGRAEFPGLGLDHTGVGFALRASSGSLTPADSNPFNNTGSAVRLGFAVQPASVKQATPFLPAPTVAVLDAAGAVAHDYAGSVTLAVKSGAGPAGATLYGTTTVPVVDGLATFANVYVDKAGSGYRLTAAAGGVSPAESDQFDAAAVRLVYRVSPSGADANDGSTWELAKRTIPAALSAVPPFGEVWVAQGTYGPVTLRPDVAVYGGFAGSETAREQRRPSVRPTVLSFAVSAGELPRSATVTAPADSTGRTVLDGFTITTGWGRLIRTEETTGWFESPHVTIPVTNCYFVGGGIYVDGGSPAFSHNVITANGAVSGLVCTWYNISEGGRCGAAARYTTERGGGIYVNGGTPTFIDNLVAGNVTSNGLDGGEVAVAGGQPVFINNTIVTKQSRPAAWTGAAASTLFVNDIVTGPTASLTAEGTSSFSHSNLYPAPTVTPSPIGADGNISALPGFVAAATGNYRLAATSPCLDAGDDSFVSMGDLDLSGNARIWGAHVDMGCYEFQTVAPATMADVISALRVAGGLDAVSGDAYAKANALAGPIGIEDAIALARRMNGKN